ncbi:hypothetical protein [Planctobacterium marinum]|uniref:hypothetical protein n=1 Tax=Planctobacterium marinum TaxID=1631968 RepID=UPI001E516B4C|nr:hypothetical protein [Planctobacterium marinum]MCC2607751.1 hypothetical protein [Planctobacterium marinum]
MVKSHKNVVNKAFIEEACAENAATSAEMQSHDAFMEAFFAEGTLDVEVQPGTQLKQRFYQELSNYPKTDSHQGLIAKMKRMLGSVAQFFTTTNVNFAPQLLTIVIAFTSGVVVDRALQGPSAIDAEQQSLKNLLVVALLNQSSAPERLTAFNFIDSKLSYDSELTGHLLEVLKNDESDGVRLAVLKHLAGALPYARKELIEALRYQNSVLVQMTIINVLMHHSPLSAEEANKISEMQNIDANLLNDAIILKRDKQVNVI